MSLLPVKSFASDVFVEARMLGQPVTVVYQIGFSIDAPECSVALFSRASGVLLVAGVGSYCAYRICTKFLGQRFVWMLLDSARFDSLASADRRLLYASELHISDSECDDYDEDGDGDTESHDELSDCERRQLSSSRMSNEVSIQRLSRYPRKSRGLFAIRQSKSGPEGVLRRQSASDRSIRSPVAACSSPSSDKSASLRIVWEGQQNWDDEFAITESRQHPSIISRTPLSQRKVAPSISAGDLGSVFDDVLSLSSSAVDQPDDELCEDVIDSDDAIRIDTVRKKCMIDSKYMYQSVVVPSSEMGSETSGSIVSSKSNLRELSKRLTRAMDPKGLWDLAQETPSTSRLKVDRNEMTDSGFSRSTHSKHSHEHRSLFDSAIGGEVFSSEDESNEKLDRHVLNPLRESDSASQMSLEWCDDGFRRRESISEDGARFVVGSPDWDYESSRGSAARSSNSPPFAVYALHRPKDSRDLMVFACEKFQPYSWQFKRMQQLYHRRRLRRIGPSPRTADETLKLFLSSVLYHGYDILKKSSPVLEKSFESCMTECNFLHRWKGMTVERMREDLHCLLDTKMMCSSSPVGESQARGLALLMVLHAREVYEGKLAGNPSCSWFSLDSPAEVMSHFERNMPLNETCWRLLGNICDVSIEILDLSTSSLNTVQFGSSRNSLQWLRVSTSLSPHPLFYVPDD